jgi:hypothetical protein
MGVRLNASCPIPDLLQIAHGILFDLRAHKTEGHVRYGL